MRLTDNPFEAPRVELAEPFDRPGHLDVGRAVARGWSAARANSARWFGVLVLAMGLGLLSIATVVGVFAFLPVLFWGAITFTLRTVDDEAKLADLFAGLSSFPRSVAVMLGFAVLYVLVSLPGALIVQMAAFSGSDRAFGLLALGHVIQIAWTFGVAMRFYFAPYFIVDQRLGPLEALRASWLVTSEQKLAVATLGLVSGLFAAAGALPALMVSAYGGKLAAQLMPGAIVMGLIPAIALASSAWAAGYRQIAGRRSNRAPKRSVSSST